MNCTEFRTLLEAHADGELDLVRQVELEGHLRSCPECALIAKALEARSAALRVAMPRFEAPAPLRARIEALAGSHAPAAANPTPHSFLWNLGGIAAALFAALWIGYAWGQGHARTSELWNEAVADHVRSLQAGHLMDVVSTDQHTVKPWFAGRVDFSPPVVDLADAGFPLAGGRLERLGGHEAAALVFHRRLHAVNLFVWPAADTAVADRQGAANGYNAESWTQGGLNFLAVSEIPEADLVLFTREFRARTKP
jgi:anti-sigma factor RsiW